MRLRTDAEFVESFWGRTKPGPNGCLLWSGPLNVWGYGKCWWRGKTLNAQRVAWAITRDWILPELLVLHTCDVPACVNPDHLFLGTDADNMADKIRKGRAAEGERSGLAKLTAAQVLEIRGCPLVSQRAFARKFGVSKPVIAAIRKGKTWRSVTFPIL